jgi:hypothetical protein
VGWFNGLGFIKGVSPNYESTIEEAVPGQSCVRLGHATAGNGEFGSLMQRCPARHLTGRTVRFEGRLRSADVAQRAGFWMRADGIGGTLFFDNMHDSPVRATTAWASYHINTNLPEGVEWLNYGVLLVGSGWVWCDKLRLLAQDAQGSWLPLSMWDAEGYPGSLSTAPINTT